MSRPHSPAPPEPPGSRLVVSDTDTELTSALAALDGLVATLTRLLDEAPTTEQLALLLAELLAAEASR